jgi:hypothetical protein
MQTTSLLSARSAPSLSCYHRASSWRCPLRTSSKQPFLFSLHEPLRDSTRTHLVYTAIHPRCHPRSTLPWIYYVQGYAPSSLYRSHSQLPHATHVALLLNPTLPYTCYVTNHVSYALCARQHLSLSCPISPRRFRWIATASMRSPQVPWVKGQLRALQLSMRW